MHRTPEYFCWQSMRRRCNSPRNSAYSYYGGRGIKVCKRWDSFQVFLSDVGPRPSADHQLDRVDNDGNYEPGNVRWATRSEQQNNKRDTRWETIDGESKPIAVWARLHGLKTHTIRCRLERGWSGRDLLAPTNAGVRGRKPSRLTPSRVVELREESARGVSLLELSRKHGVTPQAIRQAISRKHWRHVP